MGAALAGASGEGEVTLAAEPGVYWADGLAAGADAVTAGAVDRVPFGVPVGS